MRVQPNPQGGQSKDRKRQNQGQKSSNNIERPLYGETDRWNRMLVEIHNRESTDLMERRSPSQTVINIGNDMQVETEAPGLQEGLLNQLTVSRESDKKLVDEIRQRNGPEIANGTQHTWISIFVGVQEAAYRVTEVRVVCKPRGQSSPHLANSHY